MKKLLILSLLFTLGGCQTDMPPQVEIYEDEENNVTCYILDSGWTTGESMSCIPNQLLKPYEKEIKEM